MASVFVILYEIIFQGHYKFMVEKPFYQILTGSFGEKNFSGAVLTPDQSPEPVRFDLCFPSCADGEICGVTRFKGKDAVALTSISSTAVCPLFSLSDQTISHTAMSPDRQKIAFAATNDKTGDTVARVIMREEFGWFPLPFVKLPCQASPLCFCSSSALLYTAPDGALNAALLSRNPKTAAVAPAGRLPAYHLERRLTAYSTGGAIIVTGSVSREIAVDGVGTLSFAKDGKSLLYAVQNKLFRLDLDAERPDVLFESDEPIDFAAEF